MSAERNALITKLDTVHSKVVRKSAANLQGKVQCYTCDVVSYWDLLTCGHLWSRNNKSIRWDFDNTRVQCPKCQGMRNGMRTVFLERLTVEIGPERIWALQQRRNQIKQWTVDELTDLLKQRNEQLRQL